MKIDFGMIVLNGDDFIEKSLESVYNIANKIFIIEGAAIESRTGRCLIGNENGLSTDNTLNVIQDFIAKKDKQNKIVHRRVGKVKTKEDLCNHYAELADCDYLWQLDSDELYEQWVLEDVSNFLEKNKGVTCVEFETWNFFGDTRHIGVGSMWEFPFRRVFKFKKGSKWSNHTPPTLMWPGENKPVAECGILLNIDFTKKMGWHLFHYGHVTRKQVDEKMRYYSHKGFYKPGWVERVWEKYTDESVIRKYGSHSFDETFLLPKTTLKTLGGIETFIRRHPEPMSYKDSFNVLHLIEAWCGGGGCKCPYYISKMMNKIYGDSHEFATKLFGLDKDFAGKSVLSPTMNVKETIEYIKKKKFDIVHVEWWTKDKERFREIRKALPDIPFIATMHIYPFGMEWTLDPKDMDIFDGILVAAHSILTHPAMDGIADTKPVRYMNSTTGIEDYLVMEKVPHNSYVIVVSSSGSPGKKRDNTIEILKKILADYKDITLYMIGVCDPNSAYYKSLKAEFSKFINVGICGYSKTIEYFKMADLVLHILPDESFATSECFIQEAMAAGLPHIRIGGKYAENYVENGVDGFVVNTEEELYSSFRELYSNKALRETMGENARKTAKSKLVTNLSEVREFYKEIINAFKKD